LQALGAWKLVLIILDPFETHKYHARDLAYMSSTRDPLCDDIVEAHNTKQTKTATLEA